MIVTVVGVIVPPGRRDIPFASGMTIETILSVFN
jgi:hypothetical protein